MTLRLLSPSAAQALLGWSLLLVSFALAVVLYTRDIADGGSPGRTVDWLINYSGGFVRRGLAGAILGGLLADGHMLLWGTWLVQVSLISILLLFALLRLREANYSWTALALYCSPAALPFLGWFNGPFGRKECIVLAALVILSLGRSSGRALTARLAASLTLFALAVFSWESTALLSPAMVYLIRTATAHHPRLRAIGTATTIVIAGLGLGCSLLAPGNEVVSAVICENLRSRGLSRPDLCDNALVWLSVSASESMSSVLERFPTYGWFIPLAVLALVPFGKLEWTYRRPRWALALVACELPLFLLGVDYGRWIFIAVMVLLICASADGPDLRSRFEWRALTALPYLLLWGIPYWFPPTSAFPSVSAAATALTLLLKVVPH